MVFANPVIYNALGNCPCVATSGNLPHPFIYIDYYRESGSPASQIAKFAN